MKRFIKTLIPNIFYPEIAREYFNKIFFRSKIKELIKYEKNFYKRHAFINKAVSKYQNCKYLEIGVEDNSVFNSIPLKLKDKYGVDPVKGGQYRMTSDEFFKKYENLKFDVIFIDGLHTYKQCQTDCINSMRHLNKNGIIFLHDMLPKSYFEESVPRKQLSWTGDVWKVGVELFNSDNVEFKICNIDHGIGILKLKKNFKYKKIPDLKRMSFNDYLKFYKQFDLIDSEKAIDFISG
jgi:hypothetical protein